MLSAWSSSHEKQPVNKPCYQSTLFTTTGTEKWNVLTKQCSAENLQRRRNTAAALQQRGEGAKAPIADDGSAATRALRKTKTRLHFLRRGNVPSPRRVGSLPNILEHYSETEGEERGGWLRGEGEAVWIKERRYFPTSRGFRSIRFTCTSWTGSRWRCTPAFVSRVQHGGVGTAVFVSKKCSRRARLVHEFPALTREVVPSPCSTRWL